MSEVTEQQVPGLSITFSVEEVLAEETSPFQKIGFYRTEGHGVLLMLDEAVMLTERDEHVYHEMITHVPLLSHPQPERVLILGGGDLGTVRECLKHPSLVEVHQCEIDQRVVDLSREFFPWANPTAEEPRVRLSYEDGGVLIERPEHQNHYDLVIADLTDPQGLQAQSQAERLFTAEFFATVKSALREGGIIVGQCGSTFYDVPFITQLRAILATQFQHVHFYTASVPTYPGGGWCFYFASDRVDPAHSFRADDYPRLDPEQLQYYTPEVHRAAFALPARLQRALSSQS